jgi:hypothetical protein
MARGRSNRSPKKKAILLKAIAEGMTISEAAARAKMSWRSVFDWRNADPEFAAEFKLAYDAGSDVFEQEIRRRALAGSDVLLMFLSKQRDPARFNQKMVEVRVSGDPNNPIGVEHRPGGPGGAWIYPRDELARPLPGKPEAVAPLIEAVVEEAQDDRDLDDGADNDEEGEGRAA